MTLNLKLKDIDAATDAKHRLEEKQRAEARERKEKEQQWETRVRQSLSTPEGTNHNYMLTKDSHMFPLAHNYLCEIAL